MYFRFPFKKYNFGLLVVILLLPASSSIVSSAKSGYNQAIADVIKPYREGNFEKARKIFLAEHDDDRGIKVDRKAGEITHKKDSVIWGLEFAKICFDAGMYKQALNRFTDVETIINNDYNARAVISATGVSSEVFSMLTNQVAIPYSGRIYDRMMLSTYKIFCEMALGNLEGAVVDASRLEDNEIDAIEVFDFQEASSAKEFEPEYKGVNAGSGQNAVETEIGLSSWGKADSQERSIYENFRNPIAQLARGLAYRLNGSGNPEADFSELAALFPNNIYLQAELRNIEANNSPRGFVYVIHEGGMGPKILPIEIELHTGFLDFAKGEVDLLSGIKKLNMSFQKLKKGKFDGGAVLVRSKEMEPLAETSLVMNMFSVQAYEMERRFSTYFDREFARLVVQQIGKKQLEDASPALGFLGEMTTDALNKTDERNWRTLGNHYGFAVFRRPSDEKVEVELSLTEGPANPVRVELPKSDVVVIFVRSVGPPGFLDARAVGVSLDGGNQ